MTPRELYAMALKKAMDDYEVNMNGLGDDFEAMKAKYSDNKELRKELRDMSHKLLAVSNANRRMFELIEKRIANITDSL